jgi:hypothetical protein
MVLKAAIVFIAGGLMGSGILALTRSLDETRPATSGPQIATAMGTVQASTDVPNTWVDVPRAQNQHAYVQARFAAQRPFAALRPVQR